MVSLNHMQQLHTASVNDSFNYPAPMGASIQLHKDAGSEQAARMEQLRARMRQFQLARLALSHADVDSKQNPEQDSRSLPYSDTLLSITNAPSTQEGAHTLWSLFEQNAIASAYNFMQKQKDILNEEELYSTFMQTRNAIEFLLQSLDYKDRESIGYFLINNSFLIPMLREVHMQVTKYFPEATMRLEMENDQEYAIDQQLVANIVTRQEPEEAFQQLKKFDEEWWLDVLEQTHLKLAIHLEFE